MDHSARFRKYTPLLINGTITKEVYDRVFRVPYTGNGDFRPSSEGSVSTSGGDPRPVPESARVGDSGSDTGSESDQVVELLLEEFGGREITTHSDPIAGNSQKAKLYRLLSDGQYHTTDEIQTVVYGKNHLGVARIAARIHDLKKEGYEIDCINHSGTIWEYKMTTGSGSQEKLT